jgi:serine/threonine protein kinase
MYRTADPKSVFDEYICPRCRYPVVVPSGEQPRSMVCSRDGWPLITLASFQSCEGDPILGMELPGGFTPVEVIGSGSSSVVYRALFAPRSTRGRVERPPPPFAAIKLMRLDGHGHQAAMDAWEREVSALENVGSPHVVAMLDSGRVTHPASFFVALEWLEGEPLDRADRPLALGDALEAARDIASGLAALHARGFVHGDVKPRNAMRGPLRTTLFDLGSSFVEGSRQPGFDDELFKASPAYAAPERIDGGSISRAADTYSLGATLYRILAGAPPFEGAAEDVARAQLVASPPNLVDVLARRTELGDRPLRAEEARLIEEVSRAVEALLDKRADRRPTDPVALLRGLKNRSMKVYGGEVNV